MSRRQFRDDLLSLREGRTSFDAFARSHRDAYLRWAAWFHSRWPQQQVDVDDLVQESLIATWQATECWDPERTPDIARFVEARCGRAMQAVLRKARGWPRAASKTKRARPPRVYMTTSDPAVTSLVEAEHNAREADVEEPYGQRRGAELAAARYTGLQRDVVAMLLMGMTPRAIAVRLYEDLDRRLSYRFDCEQDAHRKVRRALRKAAEAAEG